MRLRRSATVLCLGLVVALGLAACGSGEEEDPTGEVVAAQADDQLTNGTESWVMVPTGVLRLFVGEPVTSLDPDEVRDRRAYDAPVGSTYVPVAWRLETKRFAPIERYLGTDDVPVIDLVSGDETYRLPPPSEGATRSFYVHVDGDGEDAQMDVGFDGVTQLVDLRTGKRKPGDARGLYQLPKGISVESQRCHRGVEFDMKRAAPDYHCELTVPLRLPYAAGEWAPTGSRWLVAELETNLVRIAQASREGAAAGGAWWSADDVTTTLRLGKIEPTSVRRLGTFEDACPSGATEECGYAAIAVFEVGDKPPRKLRIEHTYSLVRGPTWGDDHPAPQQEVTSTVTVDLEVE